MVRCPAHADGTASLSVCEGSDGKILLKCFAGCTTDSIISAIGLQMKDLFPDTPARTFNVPPAAKRNGDVPAVNPVIDKIYSYTDFFGEEVYQVVRMKPKDFRQRHKEGDKWVWNMDGVERILYHFPDVQKAQMVIVVEGEKDADNLTALGFCATCNVGGAGKWMDGYTETLEGKDVVICGDNDEAGQKHVELVFNSVAKVARTVRLLKLPKADKDISDFIQHYKQTPEAAAVIAQMIDQAAPHYHGHRLPIYSLAEIEPIYQRHVSQINTTSLDLGLWLPTLGHKIRPLVRGELAFIIGDTAAGKTAVLQSISKAALPLPTLLFELELPMEMMFERYAAAVMRLPASMVEESYRHGDSIGRDALNQKLPNLFVCSDSRLTLQDIENHIIRSELKIGTKPVVVLIDYIQLIAAIGPNRREKVSDIAEGLKVLAKATHTIILVASQVRRPHDEEDPQVTLHSAKESGSIEASCGLLLGVWRDAQDETLLHVRVLKSTKGGSGTHVQCNFDGARMLITERSQITDRDLPANYHSPHNDP